MSVITPSTQTYFSVLRLWVFFNDKIAAPHACMACGIRDIAPANSFHPQDGWLNSGPCPSQHWRLEGEISDWSFWGSHVDQGLLYYYYDKVLQQATLKLQDTEEVMFTHFTGKDKPFLHDPDHLETMRGKSREFLIRWYQFWDVVKARLDARKSLETFNLSFESAGSKSKSEMDYELKARDDELKALELVGSAFLNAHEIIHHILREKEGSGIASCKVMANRSPEFDESAVNSESRIQLVLEENNPNRTLEGGVSSCKSSYGRNYGEADLRPISLHRTRRT